MNTYTIKLTNWYSEENKEVIRIYKVSNCVDVEAAMGFLENQIDLRYGWTMDCIDMIKNTSTEGSPEFV